MNVTPDLLKKCTDGMAPQPFQPSEADVQMLCEFTGVDRAQAVVLLRKWKNVEEAAGHYFEDPVAALKEEKDHRAWERQDNIAYNDEQVGTALPPSPTGCNDSMFIDLSPQHAQAQAQIKADHALEEDQYHRAIAESMQDAHRPRGEMNTTTTPTHFGPAQRPYYDHDRWALQPIASAREVIDHPPPHKRRRRAQAPAVLIGATDTDYLPALLSIYHSIPLAREALLTPTLAPPIDTGAPGWWQGTPDGNDDTVAPQQSGVGKEAHTFLSELQRLMAFLDGSTRAYASVDRLAESRAYKAYHADSSLSRLAQVWQNYTARLVPDNPITQVFTTVAVKAVGVNGSPEVRKEMVCIEGPKDTAQDPNELLSKMVWNDTPNDVLDDICLERLGEIFTIRVFNGNSQTPLDFTATETWYFDRYTPEFRESALVMRRKCMEVKNEILKLDEIRHNLNYMPASATTPSVNVRYILDQAKEMMALAATATNRVDGTPSREESVTATTQRTLQEFVAKIDERLQQLVQREIELNSQMKEVLSDLSDPKTSSRPLRRRYELQGVCTKPNITYIRQRDTDLIDLTDDMHDDQANPDRWWRMSCGDAVQGPTAERGSVDERLPYSVEQVTFGDVVEAVQTEHHTAVLVYASTLAVDRPPVALSAALQRFVQNDNEAFYRELAEEHGSKHHGRTRTWSNGTGSTVKDEIDPFHDETHPAQAREMTPMFPEADRSSDDGQPSPKRPRSSDDSTSNRMLPEPPPPAYDAIFHEPRPEMTEKASVSKALLNPQNSDAYHHGPALPPRPPPKGG